MKRCQVCSNACTPKARQKLQQSMHVKPALEEDKVFSKTIRAPSPSEARLRSIKAHRKPASEEEKLFSETETLLSSQRATALSLY